MVNINQVNVLGTVYDIEDASAQQSITAIQGDIAEITTDLGNKAPLIESTAGPADVATFTDGASGMPMEVTVTLDPIQAGSGDPAPDNVRAISGYSGVTVYRSGKNLIPQDYENFIPGYSTTNNGVTYTINGDGSISCNGTATAASSINLTKSAATVHIPLPKGDYILSGCPAGGGASTYALRLRTQNIGGGSTTFIRDSGDGVSFSVTDTREAARVYIELASGAGCNTLVFYPMIRMSSESADYVPWGNLGGRNDLSVTFPTTPGTVYGGTLTVNRDGTGKLVVDRGYYAFDGSEDWTTLASTEHLYFLNAQSYGNFADVYLNATKNDFAISNRYVQRTYAGIASSQNGQFAIGSPSATSINRRIYVKDTACATVDDLKASLATTPMQLVFRINTPITYDLTAEQVGQITSVKGLNNVWSAGQVKVTYAADTKLYIDGKIASLQATILENISNA